MYNSTINSLEELTVLSLMMLTIEIAFPVASTELLVHAKVVVTSNSHLFLYELLSGNVSIILYLRVF